MGYLKYITLFLFVPVITCGQTAHLEENKIVYKGTVKLESADKEELYTRAKNTLTNVKGNIKLASPYHIIRSVEYVLELSAENGKYKYRIDSVYIKEKERGGKKRK